MSLLLRARGAWRAQGRRVASQLSQTAPIQLLSAAHAPHQASWPHRDAAFLTTPWTTSVRAWSSTPTPTPAAPLDDASYAALMDQLRALCKALYTENRVPTETVDDIVASWASQIKTLLETEGTAREIAHTYEQGIAIALKQREFELADALIAQLESFGLALGPELFAYKIGAVPLRWVARARPLSLEELREIDFGPNWENAVLALVRADDQPHYRKSPTEREQFHAFVRDGVTAILTEYESTVPKNEQSIEPYNAAVRAFASSGLPFKQLLRVLNQIPTDSAARQALNAETFLALLVGARWHDIPRTIERLVNSNVLQQATDDTDRKHTAARIWDQAMRAIFNTYNSQFFDKRVPLDKRRMRDLQNIYIDVDAQLLRAFPDKKFATIDDHVAVFEMRIKTAAVLGLPRQVHSLLKIYKTQAPAPVSSSVYMKALEIFPSVALKPVNAYDLERARAHTDVTEAPEVLDLQNAIAELEQHTIPAKKALMQAGRDGAASEVSAQAKTAGRELRKAQQTVTKLKKRLEATLSSLAVDTAHADRMRAADRAVDIVLEHFDVKEPRHDIDVAVAIMTQYMTAANRFVARLKDEHRALAAAHIMDRVFALLETAIDNTDLTNDDNRVKVHELFGLAMKTSALFWCDDDLQRLVHRRQEVLGTQRLDAEDYDRLVFMRVAQHDIDGAIALLKEMHYSGMAPTPLAIHRVVTGVLHKRYRSKTRKPDVAVSETDGLADDDTESDESAWSSGPTRLEDVVSFLQEWYNLYHIKPMARTVVPVFARLLATNNVWEVKRLLQILDAMDGGLAPIVEFWLEKRLADVGKSVDDLRITPKGR